VASEGGGVGDSVSLSEMMVMVIVVVMMAMVVMEMVVMEMEMEVMEMVVMEMVVMEMEDAGWQQHLVPKLIQTSSPLIEGRYSHIHSDKRHEGGSEFQLLA